MKKRNGGRFGTYALIVALGFGIGGFCWNKANQGEVLSEQTRGDSLGRDSSGRDFDLGEILRDVRNQGVPERGGERIPERDSRLEIASYIAEHEGRVPHVYCAKKPKETDRSKFEEPTVGVGHYMDRGDSKETFARVLPEVDWEGIYWKREELTKKQIDILFSEDLRTRLEITKNFFHEFENYPGYLQSALADGVFRGCLAGSPKTRRLINEGDFRGASEEYLNHQEYKTARERGKSGVAKRMEKNRDMMLRYARELEGR
jgi:hypothetical protein